MVDNSQETTHFGFQTVAKEQKADMVAHVFHSVASKYDVVRYSKRFAFHETGYSTMNLSVVAWRHGRMTARSPI